MKSTTLRRSNITREKVAMMEALSRYNRQHQDEDFYKAQNKTRELDVLWQSFGVKPNKNEKAPQVYFVTGLICGVIITLAITTVISLLINISTPKEDLVVKPSKKQAVSFCLFCRHCRVRFAIGVFGDMVSAADLLLQLFLSARKQPIRCCSEKYPTPQRVDSIAKQPGGMCSAPFLDLQRIYLSQ